MQVSLLRSAHPHLGTALPLCLQVWTREGTRTKRWKLQQIVLKRERQWHRDRAVHQGCREMVERWVQHQCQFMADRETMASVCRQQHEATVLAETYFISILLLTDVQTSREDICTNYWDKTQYLSTGDMESFGVIYCIFVVGIKPSLLCCSLILSRFSFCTLMQGF